MTMRLYIVAFGRKLKLRLAQLADEWAIQPDPDFVTSLRTLGR